MGFLDAVFDWPKTVAIATLAITVVDTTSALAAPSARLVYLRNPGAESCPDDLAIRAAVSARLGYDPFLAFAPATMFAEISKVGREYRARIKLVDDKNVVRGTRELAYDGDRCADIIDTMALSMSIAIDPTSLMRAPEASPVAALPSAEPASPTPIATESPQPTPTQPPQPAKPRRPAPTPPTNDTGATTPLAFDAGGGPSVWFGAAPAPNASGELFLRLRKGDFSVALEGRLDAPADAILSNGSVRTALTLASLVPCGHIRWFGVCFVGSLGEVRATSGQVAISREASAIHAAVGPRAALDIPVVGPLSVRAYASLLLSLTSQSLELDGASAYVLSRVSGGIGAGVALRFF